MTTPVGEGAQSGAEGTQSGAGSTTGNEGSTNPETGEGAQSGAETRTPEANPLQADLDRQRERTRAADERAARIEAELKQLRDKDLPEADKLRRDYEESQQQVVKLQEVNKTLALKVAFLSDNTYSWHNPERALKLVDLSQVMIEEDGTVSGLKEALKALATSDDYLVKKEVKEEAPKPPSTTAGNNGGAGGSTPKREQLTKRFPALNTRVRRS